MKKNEVQIGATYLVSVTGKLAPVKLLRENPHGGWLGLNVDTKREVRIRSAQRLRKRLDAAPAREDAQDAPQDARNSPQAATRTPEASMDAQDGSERPEADSGAPGARPMTLMQAAIDILSRGSGDPMRCKDIVELAVKRGLWAPRSGKTPASTLYAAILREIAAKGDESRFVKTERGKFALKNSEYARKLPAQSGMA